MSKKAIIKRLKWYYPLERMHTFISFPLAMIYFIINYPSRHIILITYSFALCIIILYQGQHYWKLKLYRLTGKTFDQTDNLRFFKKSKRVNLILIGLLPIIFIIQLYIINDSDINYKLLIWGGMAGLFGVLEHINYYYKQLMVDTIADLKYIFKNGKLKDASLAKDLREGEI